MTKQELVEEIKKILQLDGGEESIPEMNLSDAWDSMGQISVLAMLKKKTGVMISANDLAAIKTFKDIVNLLKQKGIDLE